MKAMLTLILVIAFCSIAMADVPTEINYQGKLTNSTGEPIDTIVDIAFSICVDTSAGALCVWGETHTDVEIVEGLFSVKLGSVVSIEPDVFLDDNRWLHVSIGGSGGESIEPATELLTSPYAFYATKADTAMNIANDAVTSQSIANGTIQFQDIGSNGAIDGDVMKFNGSQWMADDCMPVGVIVMWSGSLASIPTGWVLCNGSSGTPDLTDRFIYGVGTGEDPGASGGTLNHSHNVNPPSVSTQTSSQFVDVSAGVNHSVSRDDHNHNVDIPTFGSESAQSLPPYYKLAFIMKQ